MKNTIMYKIGFAVVSTLLLMLFVMLLVLLLNEENLKIENTYKSVKETDDLMRKSITFAMNGGATDLEPFKESVSDSKTLLELRLTPTNLIEDGAENNLDEVEKEVLSKLEAKYFEEDFNDIPVFRAIEVITASETCLDCHDVPLNKPLLVISGRYSMADTYDSILSQRIIATVMAIFSVAIIFFILMYFIKKRVVTPITILNESAKKVTNGDTDVHIDSIDETEIGELSASFNKMVEKISLQIGYLSNLPSPVMIINKDYEIEYMNKAGLEIVNSNSNEVLGKKCYNYLKMEHCNTEKCALKQAMRKGTNVTEENIARPNGKEYSVMYTGSPVYNRKNELVGALEFIADVSNIKNMQEYLARSTQKLLVGMSQFANGDLSANVTPEKHGDDIEKLFIAFNETVEKFNGTILTLIDAVEATASASNEISSSAEQMAAGAQEQASQTAEVSGSVSEMTVTIMDTSKNISLAADKSKLAKSVANEGGKVVKDAIDGMDRISIVVSEAAETVRELGDNSEKIGNIVQVINDIADQTNLLALNAAIEAARAGESGRGFAVVADEVRKLAERTTVATKEIGSMVKEIQTKTQTAVKSIISGTAEIENGKIFTNKAGTSLKQINVNSEELSELIGQVAATSEEQSATVVMIQDRVNSINSVTSETAIGIEQIAQASEDLNQLTEKLQSLISRFKVNNKQVQLLK